MLGYFDLSLLIDALGLTTDVELVGGIHFLELVVPQIEGWVEDIGSHGGSEDDLEPSVVFDIQFGFPVPALDRVAFVIDFPSCL